MIRRDFLKSSALVAATAALYSPLSAAEMEDTTYSRTIAIVSESAQETGYQSALSKSDKVDDVIVLGSDKLENMHTLSALMQKNKGTLLCGLLVPSDHALLSHVATVNNAKFISEIAHTPLNSGTQHTENTFAKMSVKKAFDEFASLNTDTYGIAVATYQTVGGHNAGTITKQTDFVSDHTTKNAFVSFVLKA